jgi:uncharacterized protein YjbI with pentapeptide repeats
MVPGRALRRLCSTRPVTRRPARILSPDPPRIDDALDELVLDAGRIADDAAWSRVHVEDADVSGARGRSVALEEARLEGVAFSGAALPGLRLADAELRRCDLANVRATGGAMRRVAMVGARLTGLQWTEGTIADATFRDCRIDLATFAATRMDRVTFERCLLGQADLQGLRADSVRLVDCDLTDADLSGARLTRCELHGCTLVGLRGLEALRGAAMPWADVVGMAGVFAAALGIRVLDDDDGS